jgi:predicted lipoprotein with Yx(FWY)xxD motif
MSSEPRMAAQGREAGEAHSGTRGRLSRRPLVAGLAAVAAAGLLAACSGGNGPAAAAGSAGNGKDAGATTISTRMVTGVGMVLTDQSGKTLYSPRQEAHGAIKCTGSCLGFWFPVTVSSQAKPSADSAVTGTLGSIQRSDDHSRQLTYDGEPLYTFRLDDGPGQIHGNNFTDQFGGETFNWQAVTANGTAATPSQPGNPSSYNPYQGSAGY